MNWSGHWRGRGNLAGVSIARCVVLLTCLLASGCWWGDASEPEQSPEPTPEEALEPERTEADVLEELEQRKQEEGWTFEIRPMEGIDIADGELPIEMGGYEPPDNMDDLPPVEPVSKDPLPARFDWRDERVVGPVQDQGNCGSCWAVAACTVAESVHAIAGRPLPDLSEQWLVDCNLDGWDCDGGGIALSYFVDQVDQCGSVGGIEEHHLPYTGNMSPCGCGAETLPPLGGWGMVSYPRKPASIETIKRCIKDYGPLMVDVIADEPFLLYTNGIYNNHMVTESRDDLHMAVITGWDDGQGAEGVWFLRNSWGPFWGELGWMRIEYGASAVASMAAALSIEPLGQAQEGQEGQGSAGGEGGADRGGEGGGGAGGDSGGGGGEPSRDGAAQPTQGSELDGRLDYLEEAVEGESVVELPPTPDAVEVDIDDLKPDLGDIAPQAQTLVGTWRQVAGPKTADVAPGGYTTGYLLIGAKGLLEYVRYYGRGTGRDSVKLRTTLDWTIDAGRLVVGSDSELLQGRLTANFDLPVGGDTVLVTAPKRRLPAKLVWSVNGDQLELDGRTYVRVRR